MTLESAAGTSLTTHVTRATNCNAARRELLHQAQAATYELRANQQMTFSVPESRGHDDHLNALALLPQAAKVVSRRADKGSIILTSNRGFGDWGQVFADPVVAAAIVDRLLGNAAVLNIRGRSYRMRLPRSRREGRCCYTRLTRPSDLLEIGDPLQPRQLVAPHWEAPRTLRSRDVFDILVQSIENTHVERFFVSESPYGAGVCAGVR